MSTQAVGLKAYNNALQGFVQKDRAVRRAAQIPPRAEQVERSFADTFQQSLRTVNDLQSAKASAVESFASGETQNVHELMISLQKAGLAMNLTSAVRNKVMEAYRELSRMQF
ncbi:MAG: flagellar hook-basal body complex protein FliE [Deltaproteobacteria bacterium]|jgi:flagellar hook-basal body complex protein FliE|nr:flagellar hook-basal body complex protein FliE [Deltaproteobacteria bacterium]